jgi:hypothetical protein
MAKSCFVDGFKTLDHLVKEKSADSIAKRFLNHIIKQFSTMSIFQSDVFHLLLLTILMAELPAF